MSEPVEGESAGEPADADPSPTPPPPPVEQAPEVAREKGRAFEFAVQTLRMSPDITYQDLRARARMAEMEVPPIVYGRAKALLGLVPTKPRRPRAEPPRMLRQVDSATEVDRLPALDGIRSLEQLVQTVRTLEQERQLLRAALAAIQQTVQEALADG